MTECPIQGEFYRFDQNKSLPENEGLNKYFSSAQSLLCRICLIMNLNF